MVWCIVCHCMRLGWSVGCVLHSLGVQGWHCGEITRFPPMWLRFELGVVWVKFVVGSRPCSKRFFLSYSGFPLSSKTNISKFQFDLE